LGEGGAAPESLTTLRKPGPPLRPDTRLPHLAAGRCMKCHDIVIKVPVEQ